MNLEAFKIDLIPGQVCDFVAQQPYLPAQPEGSSGSDADGDFTVAEE